MTHLIVDITIDGITKRAEGCCFIDLMQSINEDPWDHSRLISDWKWVRSHDGYKGEPQPEPPKQRKPSAKTQDAIARKWESWSK